MVKEGETPPPALTIRVCDSLSCELAGAANLQKALQDGLDPSQVRVLRAPCMGRCDTAPVLELGHNHIDHATVEAVERAIAARATHPIIPDYETLSEYQENGGYRALYELANLGIGKRYRIRFCSVTRAWWCRFSIVKMRLVRATTARVIWP